MNAKTEVLEILSNYIDTPVETIDTSMDLKFSACIDSFVMLSFVGAVEEHFNVIIPNEKLCKMTTLDDIIELVENNN